MGKKGFISEFMNGGRILSHGQIMDLSNGFALQEEIPFSIYIRPKHTTSALDAIVSVRCYQEDEFSNAPIVLHDWTPLAITGIAPDSSILEQYDIYWGCGQYVDKTV